MNNQSILGAVSVDFKIPISIKQIKEILLKLFEFIIKCDTFALITRTLLSKALSKFWLVQISKKFMAWSPYIISDDLLIKFRYPNW